MVSPAILFLMAATKKSAPKKKTASPSASGQLFLFCGTDTAKSKEEALRLCQKLAPPGDEFGLEIINGTAENTDHAIRILANTTEAIQTLPFLGGDKVVWLQGTNIFGDNVTGNSEGTLKAVGFFLEVLKNDIPPNVKVIISASEMNKVRVFFKHVSAIATVQLHDKIDTSKAGWEAQAVAWVATEAQKLGLRFGPGAMEHFVTIAGADPSILRGELEKLSLYYGPAEISPREIMEMVTPSHAGVIFEIGEMITRKDLPRTLDLIEAQLRKGENPVGIMRAAIIPKVRGLLHAKDLAARHRLPASNYRAFEAQLNALPETETAHLSRKKEGGINAYPLFLSAESAKSFTVTELTAALEACLEADLRLVTTQLDPRLVLFQLVAKILK